MIRKLRLSNRKGRLACVAALIGVAVFLRSDERAIGAAEPLVHAAIASASTLRTLHSAAASTITDAASRHRKIEPPRAARDTGPLRALAAAAASRKAAAARGAASSPDNANVVDVQDYFITEATNLPRPQPGVDVGMVEFALESKDFADIVALLAEQSAGDDLLVQLNNFYREAIRGQLAATEGDMRLEHLACGVTLCIGEIDARSDDDEWLAWEELFDEDPGMKAGNFNEYSLDEKTDQLVRHRFLFFIDPAFNVAVIRF